MRIIVIVIFLLTHIRVNGQIATTTEGSDTNSVYFQALNFFCENYYILKQKKSAHILIEKNWIIDDLPSVYGGISVNFIDHIYLDKNVKKHNPIEYFRLIPIRFKNGQFYITIIHFKCIKAKGVIQNINMGGMDVKFDYDCVAKKFEIQEEDSGRENSK